MIAQGLQFSDAKEHLEIRAELPIWVPNTSGVD